MGWNNHIDNPEYPKIILYVYIYIYGQYLWNYGLLFTFQTGIWN